MVRPDRQGLKVAEMMADAGDTVTAGPAAGAADPARWRHHQRGGAGGGAGLAVLGRDRHARGGKGEALFSIIARSEFDLVGMVPVKDIAQAAGRTSRADQDHRRRRGRRPGAPGGAHRRAEQPARPGVHRHHASRGGFWSIPSGARADQDRAELRHLGAADRDPLRHRRHRGAGGAARRGSRRGGSRPG